MLGDRGFNDAIEALSIENKAAPGPLWGKPSEWSLSGEFPNAFCVDADKNKKRTETSNFRLFGLLDINMVDNGKAGKDPNNATLYYRNYGSSDTGKVENVKLRSGASNFGKWAYENYASVSGASPIKSEYSSDMWQNYFYKAAYYYQDALQNYMIPLQYYPGRGNRNGQSSSQPAIAPDADNYGEFAKNVTNAGGSTIVAGTTVGSSTNKNGVATAGPYSFSKYIMDNYQYGANGDYANRDKEEPGTCQKVTVIAKLSDGRTVNNPDIIVNGNKISNLKTELRAGVPFTVRVNNAGSATIETVIFTSTYYTYGGRVYFVGGTHGSYQCRSVVTGTRTQQTDNAIFGTMLTPENPDIPGEENSETAVLAIEKVDENGNKLANAELEITIDGKSYSKGKVKTAKDQDIIIYIDELLKGDASNKTHFVELLEDTDINNASKLFKDPCDNTVDDIREFIRSVLNEKVWNAVGESAVWKKWQEDLKKDHTMVEKQGVRTVEDWVGADAGNWDTWECPYKPCKEKRLHMHTYPETYTYKEHDIDNCDRCEAEKKIKKYTPLIDSFIANYPTNTETLIKWLENGGFNIVTECPELSEIFASGGSDWIDFKYSIYDLYTYSNYRDDVITQKDILKVFTGKITVAIKETSAPDGYIRWANGQTKTIIIEYKDGKIINGVDQFKDGYFDSAFKNTGAYLEDRNDEVEIEHRAIKEYPSDGTYQIAKITAYDQTNREILRLRKTGNYGDITLAVDATFEIKITTREKYWNGSINEKIKTFNKTTSNGFLDLTAQDFRDIGIDVISRWTGTIKIEVRETVPPPGFIPIPGSIGIVVEYNKGKATVTEKLSNAYGESFLNGDLIEINAVNTIEESSNLILKKVGKDGVALQGATFRANLYSEWNQLDWNSTTEKWESNHYTGNTTITGTTGTLGEIIVSSDQLRGLGIYNLSNWTGTLTINIQELVSPNGYNKVSDQTVILYYNNGTITSSYNSNYIDVKIENVSYDEGAVRQIPVIIVKDSLDSILRIRKVDEYGYYLTGAKFSGTITAGGRSQTYSNLGVDSNGYIDLTNIVNTLVGELGAYSGTITVTMRETQVPAGHYGLSGTATITLRYEYGKLISATSSSTNVNVGKANNGKDVTIAVTNNTIIPDYTLEPIYISKVDSQTGVGIPNVGFNITVSTREDLNLGNKTLVLNNQRTNQDGLITITKENLQSIGVPNGYNGNVYVAIEEFEANSDYEKLTEEIHLIVTFSNGYVSSITYTGTDAQKQVARNHCEVSNNNNKIKIKNTLKPIDLVLQKTSLANGEVFNVEATFTVDVYTDASNAKGHKVSKTLKTNPDGQIIFTGDELKTLEANSQGKLFDGTYTGNLYVKMEEIDAQGGASLIPETVTVTLKLVNGRYDSSNDGNSAHVSIKTDANGCNVTLFVGDYIKGTKLLLRGKVWEELSENKAGTLIDGMYTETSASEKFDTLMDGIEVTLYRLVNNELRFVEVSKGTNPTFTVNGEYEFQIDNYVAGQDDYVVMFTYNGVEYLASPITANSALANWELSSKASEINGNNSTIYSRKYVNNTFAEIGSYPANYKIANKLFTSTTVTNASKLTTIQSKFAGGDYNIAYRYDQIADIQAEVSRAFKEELLDETGTSAGTSNKNNLDITTTEGLKRLANIYLKVAEKYEDTDGEIYNKLQFIYDTRVRAIAGYYTNKDGVNSLSGVGKYPYSSTKTVDENGHTVQGGINLGLYKRARIDLHLEEDIVDTLVSINGYDATYSLNKALSEYKQYLYQEDFKINTNENSDGTAWYANDNAEIEFYVKYKIHINNSATTKAMLQEIVDYYDSRFSFNKDGYTTSSGKHIEAIEIYKNGKDGSKKQITPKTGDSKYIEQSKIGLDGVNDKYGDLYIGLNSEESLETGESLDIYVTFKLGKDGAKAKDILKDILKDDGSGELPVDNYAEINGYKTADGNLDGTSNPGNMKVKEYEKAKDEFKKASANRGSDRDAFDKAKEELQRVKENDAWTVKLNVSTNLDGNNPYHRTLTGNVWKALDEYANPENLLQYSADRGFGGIIVELVEIEPDGTQVVRARTVTNADGSYTFTRYIPGDYTVRFSYGETFENVTVDGDGFTKEQKGAINETSKNKDGTGINGQYYQSVKANDKTNDSKYWYAENAGTRYSDAYDEVTSRLEQIDAHTYGELEGETTQNGKTKPDNSWSWNYEVDGIKSVESRNHVDKIEAYTSTLSLEVEYTDSTPEGNKDYESYRYPITNVDFGVQPRAEAEMNIEKRVSNIKLYMQDGTKQLDADIKEDGKVEYNNANIYKNSVITTPGQNNNSYRDGLIEALFDTQLLNGTTLEVTYTITASAGGDENTLRYFYNSGDLRNPIAVAYYKEDLDKIVYYEDGNVRTHATDAGKWELKACDGGQKDVEVRTRATNIVDYIDPSLNFIQRNKEGIEVNGDWEITSANDFNSSREKDADVMKKYNTIIRAKGGETKASYLDYLASYNKDTAGNIESGSSVLYTPMKRGDKQTTTLTLSTVLGTSSTGTNDYEYSNLMEITKLENYAGKSTKLKAYDITGTVDKETSGEPSDTKTTPTVGTSKSETIVIHEPTGLTAREEAKSNLGIVLVALVILAVGIVLIKKFVLKPKTE